jgi:hypothetical protein
MVSNHNNTKIAKSLKSLKQMAFRSALVTAFMVTSLGAASHAAELPEAPSSVIRMGSSITPMIAVAGPVSVQKLDEVKVVNKTFVALALISSGSSFADSYTTLFARENWLGRKQGACNVEIQSPYLYGTHPTVGRTYAVASVKSAGTVLAAYYLRKHHSRFWSAPLVANSLISLEGVTQNMIACN